MNASGLRYGIEIPFGVKNQVELPLSISFQLLSHQNRF